MATFNWHCVAMSNLPEFHTRVAKIFFQLPSSNGFLLAGGAALLATGFSNRPTEDLDFFGDAKLVNVTTTAEQFEVALGEHALSYKRIQFTNNFVRLLVRGDAEVLVDIAIDIAARRKPTITIAGPVFDLEELAGRKLLAIYDRAEARDFSDLFLLASKFANEIILACANELVVELDLRHLAQMFDSLNRFEDQEIPVASDAVIGLRNFYQQWSNLLRATNTN